MHTQQIPFHFFGREPVTLDSFVGESNGLVVQQIRRLARGNEGRLIYLWGRGGCGKTHLLHAACNEAHARRQRTVCIDCAEHAELTPALLDGLEQLALVCLDNLHEIAGRQDWERAVLRLFEGLRQRCNGLLIASRCQPAQLGMALPDLHTRLSWDLVCRVQAMSDEEKIAALGQRARLRALELSEEVGSYLLRHVSRDPHRLFELLERLDAASLAAQRRLTIPFVRAVIGGERGA